MCFHFLDYENQVHRVCSIRDLTCLDKYTHLIRSSMPGVEIERENNKSASIEWDERDYSCGCLPDCEFVDYVFEASQGTLTRKYSSNQRNL
ncbi:hypothetical protein HHI36_008663 [Cryptolaemus montrouzieri]|uniref:Uncharacterized protein n=1 Tax=Cryptolaemus montrouzieri TaxID=559131 RepID=A0ABD2MTU5_9CUCU